jgi:hypothetical protein
MSARSWSVLAVVALATSPAPGAPAIEPAARCPTPTDEWTVVRGDLAPSTTCGGFVASTDAGDTRFTIGGVFRHVSLARFAWREPVTVPYEVSLDWQWLTPGRWHVEIHGLGVVVLLATDNIGFYVDDAQLMGSTFEQFAPWSTLDTRKITVRQTEREIAVLIDGKPIVSVDGRVVGRRVLADAPNTGTLMLGLRGAPGERTKGVLRAVQVRSLTSR